jgi:DNA-directed RNA polymerase alpha subunit
MSKPRQFSSGEAKRIGDLLELDWDQVDVEQFRMGLLVRLEHRTIEPETNVTDDDLSLTGKIALAHLREFPDYYTRLAELEAEADTYWAKTIDRG